VEHFGDAVIQKALGLLVLRSCTTASVVPMAECPLYTFLLTPLNRCGDDLTSWPIISSREGYSGPTTLRTEPCSIVHPRSVRDEDLTAACYGAENCCVVSVQFMSSLKFSSLTVFRSVMGVLGSFALMLRRISLISIGGPPKCVRHRSCTVVVNSTG
jgi:hypothetical protein